MRERTRRLWSEQDRHVDDRWRLFRAVAAHLEAESVVYPGCYVDIAPSFVFPSVTYVDTDRRTPAFFGDDVGLLTIISEHEGAPELPELSFIHGDYTEALDLPDEGFDLLVSLYAGFVSEHCTRYLRVGGVLLVNPSHGDAAMASIDGRYRLSGVVTSRSGSYHVGTDGLDGHLVPRQPVEITRDLLHERGRGIAYTRSPFAYLFERVR